MSRPGGIRLPRGRARAGAVFAGAALVFAAGALAILHGPPGAPSGGGAAIGATGGDGGGDGDGGGSGGGDGSGGPSPAAAGSPSPTTAGGSSSPTALGAAVSATGTPAPATSTTAAPPRVPTVAGRLPFDLPTRATLRASKHLVFAHYFTPYPISLDDRAPSADYYATQYLEPTGEGGKHQAYGGLLRDRPLGRDPIGGDYASADLATEVEQAVSAGIDGFAVDILSLTSQHWTRVTSLLAVAQRTDPGFTVMLMPDMTTLGDASPESLAAAMATLAAYPSAFRLADGRLVVSPFKAENHSAAWWTSWLSIMADDYGIKVAFVPTFLDWQSHADDFAPISYGFSHWGTANPNAAAETGEQARKAHRLDKLWMAPVRVQDVRPAQGIFDESGGTTTLRRGWAGVIEGDADWVQIPTWNDYSEGSSIAPSLRHGWAYLDISAYYLARWKTGRAPKITRDALYLIHRTQPADAVAGFAQTVTMHPRASSPAAIDRVEVLAFLTSAATVTVTVGQHTYSWSAKAGISSKTFPLAVGEVAAAASRAGEPVAAVTSRLPVAAKPWVQNLDYVAVGSLR